MLEQALEQRWELQIEWEQKSKQEQVKKSARTRVKQEGLKLSLALVLQPFFR